MSKNERKTDFFIGKLLGVAEITYTPNGSDIKEIQDALKTASKKGTGRAGFPEFVAMSKDFILVVENKADLDKQVVYDSDKQSALMMDAKSITGYAENGALHYAQVIVEKTPFKKVFAFGCSGDEKHHCIRPLFVDKAGYKLLDEVENFEILILPILKNIIKSRFWVKHPKRLKKKKKSSKRLPRYMSIYAIMDS